MMRDCEHGVEEKRWNLFRVQEKRKETYDWRREKRRRLQRVRMV